MSQNDANLPSTSHSGMRSYTKKTNAGAKGVKYQLDIITVFLLNAFLQELKNWELSSEDPEIEGFEDVVLKWDGGVVSLQAKYRDDKSKKITKSQLLSTNAQNSPFSLPKYFLAYQKNKNLFGRETAIICTNSCFHEKILEYVKENNIDINSKLFYENGSGIYYTFDYNNKDFPPLLDKIKTYYRNNDYIKGKVEFKEITEENIKDFLDHLECHCNYPPEDDMEKVLETMISEAKERKLLHGQISPSKLREQVSSWYDRKEDFYINETYAKAMFSEICKDVHCQRLQKYDVSIETDFNFQGSNRFYHITVQGGYLLLEIKVFRTLQNTNKKFLYVSQDDGIEVLKQAIEAFKFPLYKTLVLVWSETCKNSVVNEVGNLIDVLNKYQYRDGDKVEDKKVILIAQSIETLPLHIKQNCTIIEGGVTFKDVSKGIDLLKRDVIFQGENISLRDLCGVQEIEWYEKALDADVLEQLVRHEEVEVGVQVACLQEDVRQFYINRTFQRKIKKADNESFRPNMSEESFSEESLWNVNEKVIVVSDIAGMGKSTVLTTLADITKRKNPKLWVIRINLNEYTEILSNYVDNKKQSITIEELLNSKTETKLKNGLENELFSMQGKVVLMLDGIDEISPDYTTPVIGMLVQCQKKKQNFAKIIVTTRPHFTKKLESKLNVKPFKLQPFIKKKQVNFLTRYWTCCLKLNGEKAQKCEQFAEELLAKLPRWSMYSEDHFGAIPQHLQMLAKIFQDKNPMDTFVEWQGCVEFVKTDNLQPKLPDDMDLVILYKIFIETKRKLFINKGDHRGNTVSSNSIKREFEKCLGYHQSLALKLIVGKKKCPLFSNYEEICPDDKEMIYKMGIIVQERYRKWHFVHRTFAEYFASQSIIEELKGSKENIKFQTFFIEEILIDKNYNVTRTFLNNRLNSILDELPADIFDSYKSKPSTISLNQQKKFKVIHRLASEGCVAILRLLFKCIKVETAENQYVEINQLYKYYGVNKSGSISSNVLKILETLVRKGQVNIQDKDGRTPLYYAIENNRLEMVKFLVEEKNADITVKGVDDLSIPYKAILDNRQEIVRIFFNKMLREGPNPNDGLAMFTAAYLGELDVLKELVGRGADLNCGVEKNETPLFAAVRGRQLETVKYLVSQGADVNVKTDNKEFIKDETALHVAIYRGFLDVVEVLVDCGAELDIEDYQWQTPLFLAALYGHLDIVKFLVDRGASLRFKNNTNYSIVMVAPIIGCHEHIVEYLLGLGVDIMARDEKGQTVLHRAAYYRKLDVVKLIMKFDVKDVNVKDDEGNTPLHLAANENHKNIFELLVEHGANVNAKNDEGLTPQDLFDPKNKKKFITSLNKT